MVKLRLVRLEMESGLPLTSSKVKSTVDISPRQNVGAPRYHYPHASQQRVWVQRVGDVGVGRHQVALIMDAMRCFFILGKRVTRLTAPEDEAARRRPKSGITTRGREG